MNDLKGKGSFIVKTNKGQLFISLDDLEISYDLERNYFYHAFGSEEWTAVENIKLNDSDIEMKFQEKIDNNDFDFWDNEFDTTDIKIISWELRGELYVD